MIIKNIVNFVVLCLVVSCINSDKRQETKQRTTPENIRLFDSLVNIHINNGEKIRRHHSNKYQKTIHNIKIERLKENKNQ